MSSATIPACREADYSLWAKLSEMIRSDGVVDQVYQLTQRLLSRRQNEAGALTLAADLAKVQRGSELWYTRHDEAAGDAEKEAAWPRIVQLAEKESR